MIGETFRWVPSEQTRDEAPPGAVSAFGDGYAQRYELTLKTMGERYTLRFRRPQDLDQVEGFLAARRALEWFNWTPRSGVQARFICRSWSRPKQPGRVDELLASFERVYQ